MTRSSQFNKEFWPHGRIEVTTVHRCLYMQVHGAVNQEGAQVSRKLIRDTVLAQGLDHFTWGAITDFSHFQLATPDAAAVLRESYEWSIAHGQLYGARVNCGTLQREYSDSLHAEDIAGFQSRYFDSLQEAEHWFKALGLLQS